MTDTEADSEADGSTVEDTLRHQIEDLREAEQRASDEVGRLADERRELINRIRPLENELSGARATNRPDWEVREELSDLEQERDEKTAEVRKAEEKLDRIVDRRERAEEQLGDVRDRVDEIHGQIEDWREYVQDLEREIDRNLSRVEGRFRHVREARSEVGDLLEELESLDGQPPPETAEELASQAESIAEMIRTRAEELGRGFGAKRQG